MHHPRPGGLQAASLTPEQATTHTRPHASLLVAPPLRLDDKQEGGVTALSCCVSTVDWISRSVCVADT